jgi:hypothetical protein
LFQEKYVVTFKHCFRKKRRDFLATFQEVLFANS